MFKYNLIGQRGIAGERNPDPNLTDDVATYMYDFPPGQGDNKGATKTNKPVAKKEVEEKKVEVALENPNSYIARKPEVKTEVVKKEKTEVKSKPVTLEDRASQTRKYTDEEFNNLKNTSKEEKLAAEQKIKELVAQYEIEMEKNITDRWKSDMNSDSWLSKNVRPMVLIFLVVCTVLMIFIDAGTIAFEVEEKWTDLLQLVLITVIGAYFGGRSFEKRKK